jgi:hypothetical protein
MVLVFQWIESGYRRDIDCAMPVENRWQGIGHCAYSSTFLLHYPIFILTANAASSFPLAVTGVEGKKRTWRELGADRTLLLANYNSILLKPSK